MPFKTHRAESKVNYGDEIPEGKRMNDEQLMLGAALRIADALEKSVEERLRTDRDLKYYKEKHVEHRAEIDRLNRKISANEGVKTKMKSKIAEKDALILHLRKGIVEL